jgi:GlpG protein
MREIGSFDREEDARRFADYLLTQEIPTQVRAHGGKWSIWAIPEDRVVHARAEMEQFRAEPDHPRYRAAPASAREIRKDDQRAEKEYRKNFRDLTGYWDHGRPGRSPITHALIAASVGIFFLTMGGNNDWKGDFLISQYLYPQETPGFAPLPEVREGQVWRLITPIFLHFSPIHLIFNMMALVYFGTQVEYKHGSFFLLAFVIGSAAVSNVAQYFDSGPNFGGMSGVAYALIGYVWIRSSYEHASGLYVHPQAVFIAMVWLIMGFLGPLDGSMRMANIAHLAGLAFGLVVGTIPYLRQQLAR